MNRARSACRIGRARCLGLLLALPALVCGAAAPEPPRVQVELAYEEPAGELHRVPAGGDFQAALDRAAPGDVIELEAGARYAGPFVLPAKRGEDWILVRSSAHAELPPPGTRLTPAQAPLLPKLEAARGSVLASARGAHHYRFSGVEIRPSEGVQLTNLVLLGHDEERLDDLPHHIVFERSYLHGDPAEGSRRGIALNGREMAVVDSWLADFKEEGAGSQAILGWNGPGPFLIRNNHLEAAGENLMFGGATPAIQDLVPADIEVLGNHFHKPLTWREEHPEHAGRRWSVKNLFELKNARRVRVEGNLFEHNWAQAQNGFAILFTVRNEGGAVPWAAVEDVRFQNNLLRGIGGGFNVLGKDDNGRPSVGTRRIEIRNNFLEDLGGDWGEGRLLQLLQGVEDFVFLRNTARNDAHILMTDAVNRGFVFRGNVVHHNRYGIIGDGAGPGGPTLQRYFPDAVLEDNLVIGGSRGSLPRGNHFAASESRGLRDPDRSDFRPRDAALEAGVDSSALCAALTASERPAWCGSPPDVDAASR